MPQNSEYNRTNPMASINEEDYEIGIIESDIESPSNDSNDSPQDRAASTDEPPVDTLSGNGDTKLLLSRLGLRLQKRRAEMGLSQWQLSEKAGINRTYLSDIERGVCNATISMLSKLAKALDMKLWVLLKDLDV
jgi:ribosome-binding protein aMBF1 (putative translation factor)